jgi:hypothetical protein
MESEETELTVLFAGPLDHTLFAEADVLGYSADIAIGNRPARLELPRARHTCSHSLALQPPNSAPDSLGLYLEGKYWGLTRERGTEVELEAVRIAVPIRARLGFPLAENQIGGDTVRRLLEAVLEWYDSLIHWIWVVTAQSLDPTNPDPKVVNRRSRNIVLAARAGDVMSFPTSGEASMTIVVDLGSPKSERLVNRRVLDYIVPRVGNGTPPLMWELLASARMAARRGDVRRALIDAGTAAESALSVLAPPAPKARPTLGTQVKDAPKKGIVLPSDTWTVLVEPRNHAIHRGQWSPGGVDRALEIAEDIVALADPAMPRASFLPHKFRPQRNDIKIIRPPHQ